MRLYSPNQQTLQALRGSNIELILDVPNSDLQRLASDPSEATRWVQRNVVAFSDVRILYISVGNEVDPNKGDTSQYRTFVLPAMQNVHNAIVAAGLQNRVQVSTATYSGILTNTFPPSRSTVKENVRTFINPIIQFLVRNNLPLLANVYPYFSYVDANLRLDYALFTRPGVEFTDPDRNLQYRNLFDALLDSLYAALEKIGGSNVKIVVSESGWPSEGRTGATTDNAGTYYRNLIGHVRGGGGTPRRPNRAIEVFLFAMFDENSKPGNEVERHFGLFTPRQQPKYQITFR
jgi:hypothetical protein